jgi:hypothetical protein
MREDRELCEAIAGQMPADEEDLALRLLVPRARIRRLCTYMVGQGVLEVDDTWAWPVSYTARVNGSD